MTSARATDPAVVANEPASSAQQRFWLLHELAEQPGTLALSLAFELTGSLDEDRFEDALGAVVARHEALRTRFVQERGGLRQVVTNNVATRLERDDLLSLDDGERARRTDAALRDYAHSRFDLARGPLLRARAVRAGEESWLLLLAVHHIAADEWSLRMLLRDLSSLYAGGTGTPALPYRELARREREWLASDEAEAALEHWRATLRGAPAATALPGRPSRPPVRDYSVAEVPVPLTGKTAGALDAFGRTLGATMFMVLLAALARLLERSTGDTDIVVGTPSGGRPTSTSEDTVGPLINTAALRLDASAGRSFADLVLHARDVTLAALDHARLPFERVVSALELPRDSSRAPLCQVMLITQGDLEGELSLPGLRCRLLRRPSQVTSELDLTFVVAAAAGGTCATLEYARDLYQPREAREIAASFAQLLADCLERPYEAATGGGAPILVQGPAGGEPLGAGRCVDELIENAARRHPRRAAVEAAGKRLDYGELERRSALVAAALRRRGVGPDARVGICMESSVDTLVAILAALRAGGAYVPLDPEYPRERLALMHGDARPVCVIGPRDPARRVALDATWTSVEELVDAAPDPDARDRPQRSHEDLAYVLYTSGSTGRPKGVAMPHRALSNLIEWQRERSGGGRTLQFAPLSFDVSFQEIFSTWAAGGALVLPPPGSRRDLVRVSNLVAHEGIERLFVPFVALQEIARISLEADIRPHALREVIVAGEQLVVTPEIRDWFAELPDACLENQYGPTETHVVTAHRLGPEPRDWPRLPPIGAPIAGVRCALLRSAGAREHDVGEIVVGGACLSRGYLGRPAETAARYVPDPDSPGQRIYRTGDLGRLRSDGMIEYVGRGDEQVKVRGHRVELGEIEARLREHAWIREAAAIALKGPGRPTRLVAVVVGPEGDADAQAVREWLAERLPAWMVPGRVVPIDAIPLTPSGKIDRRAVEAHLTARDSRDRRAPRNDLERRLVAIWQDVLGIDAVGISTDFLSAGGDSLTATRLVSRIRAELGRVLPVAAVFEHVTVAEQAALLADGAQPSAARR